MAAILKKELWSYLGHWSSWIVFGLFSLITTLFLFFFENNFNFFDIGFASMQSYFALVPWAFMFLMPAFSMKSLAEESQTGTLEWLFVQPVGTFSMISAKFLAVWIMGALCLVPSLIYIFTLSELAVPSGNLDWGMTLGSYFGTVILAGGFAALGILSSSLAKNQVTGYLLGLFLSFIFWFGLDQLASYNLMGNLDYFIQNLGFPFHFNGFSRGLLSLSDLSYFLFIGLICLSVTYIFIEKRKF